MPSIKFFLILALLAVGPVYLFSPEEWVGIINGDPVENPLPVIVSINMNVSKLEFIGSGIVISKDWVLTVGHLFLDFEGEDFDNVLLGYGSDDRSKQVLMKPDQIISPFFNVTTRLDDIAFVHAPDIGRDILSGPFKVAINNMTSNGLNQLSNLTLVGWGSTKNARDKVVPQQLQMTRMGYCDLNQCRRQLINHTNPHYRHVLISDQSSFCMLNNHSTACYGDSGSPVYSTSNNTILLYGLVSWGNNSCTLGYPNVFTNIYHFVPLIQNITGQRLIVH